MPFYEKGDVRIHYEEVGSGFPLLLIPGGGLNSTIAWNTKSVPFNPVEEFQNEYRCITADLRNAYSGQSCGPFIWNLLQRAPERLVAAVASQPSGWPKELPNLFYESNMQGWGPEIATRRPDSTMERVDRFLTRMYRGGAADFVYTVSRDFVRSCQTPVLVMPDDSPPHPYAIAMESVMLAPQSEVSLFPWKNPTDRIPVAVRQVRSFLRAHRPAMA